MADTIQVKAGEAFEVVLEGSPTTGYKWELTRNGSDTDLVEFTGQALEANTSRVGGSAVQRFSFRAVKPGSTRLQFAYRRPWEAEPRSSREYVVMVQA